MSAAVGAGAGAAVDAGADATVGATVGATAGAGADATVGADAGAAVGAAVVTGAGAGAGASYVETFSLVIELDPPFTLGASVVVGIPRTNSGVTACKHETQDEGGNESRQRETRNNGRGKPVGCALFCLACLVD